MNRIINRIVFIILILISFNSYSQLNLIDTNEPKTNIIIYNNETIASSNIYNEYVDISFFDRRNDAVVTFSMTNQEFKQIGDLLINYDAKDGEYYQLKVNKGILSIRYVESFGYKKALINLRTSEKFYHFPELNRNQFSKLFKI